MIKGMKSSINWKPVKPSSEKHNRREEELDYVRPDLKDQNEHWELANISDVRKQIEDRYLKTIGQKMQEKATPIRESVVLIKPDTSMEDLKRVGERLEQKYGMRTFQIHIHRDEGHINQDTHDWTPNLHAHLVHDWTDEKTGKSVKLKKSDLSQIQTLVAEELGMDRGELKVNTNRERLEPIEFKKQEREREVKLLEAKKLTLSRDIAKLESETKKQEANTELHTSDLESFSETFLSRVTLNPSKKKKERREQLQSLRKSVKRIQSEKKIFKLAEKLSPSIPDLRQELNSYENLIEDRKKEVLKQRNKEQVKRPDRKNNKGRSF